jgi:hypothetical protein
MSERGAERPQLPLFDQEFERSQTRMSLVRFLYVHVYMTTPPPNFRNLSAYSVLIYMPHRVIGTTRLGVMLSHEVAVLSFFSFLHSPLD